MINDTLRIIFISEYYFGRISEEIYYRKYIICNNTDVS